MNIVLTGGGSGVGYQTALQLVRDAGHLVFVISRNEKNLESLKTEAGEKAESRLVTIAADITKPDDLKRCLEKIVERASWIDVLINNAGKLINKPFHELTSADWSDVYATNIFAVVGMINSLVKLLEKAPEKLLDEKRPAQFRSHIVNISSMGGIQGTAKFNGLSAYSSSKAALINLTECLAVEFLSKRIAVNCLALGSVDTQMFKTAFPGYTAATDSKSMAAYLVLFALSGQNFFNGKTLPVSASTP